MKNFVLMCICVFLCLPFTLKSQTGVKTSFERGSKGEYVFYADNPNYCPYTVELIFSKLENAAPSAINIGTPFQTVVQYGRHRILTINRAAESRPIDFRYVSNSIKGNIRASIDTNFVYLLPIKPDSTTRINRTVNLEKLLDSKEATRTTGLTFEMKEGDTVYACRAGMVSNIQDNSASTNENTAYASQENFVEIYHKDGSFANYTLLKNNGIFVEAGETVTAGQPIGIIGGNNYNKGSHLRFRTYYLYKDNSTENENGRLSYRVRPKIFIPVFHLGPNINDKPAYHKPYTCEHPENVIMQEMNKSQKKKYLKEHPQK